MWVGIPSTFIRVSGCNLRCVWCDTPYASWSPEGPTLNLNEILVEVKSRPARHVVVTGGEPMIFSAVAELSADLRESGFIITIETAGTRFMEVAADLMSISPKLSHSTPVDDPIWSAKHEKDRLNIPVLTQLLEKYPNYQLKFVVGRSFENDIAEIEQILTQLSGIRPDRVILMAEGIDATHLLDTQRLLVAPCIERGWRLSPRFHVDLFGNTKGT